MANRVPLRIEVGLEGFTMVATVPLDLTAFEARWMAEEIERCIPDPSEAAKYAVCDPTIYPGITE